MRKIFNINTKNYIKTKKKINVTCIKRIERFDWLVFQ